MNNTQERTRTYEQRVVSKALDSNSKKAGQMVRWSETPITEVLYDDVPNDPYSLLGTKTSVQDIEPELKEALARILDGNNVKRTPTNLNSRQSYGRDSAEFKDLRTRGLLRGLQDYFSHLDADSEINENTVFGLLNAIRENSVNEVRISGRLASSPKTSPDGLAATADLDISFRHSEIVRVYAISEAASFLKDLSEGADLLIEGKLMMNDGKIEILAVSINFWSFGKYDKKWTTAMKKSPGLFTTGGR